MYDFKPFWLADNMARSPTWTIFAIVKGREALERKLTRKSPAAFPWPGFFSGSKAESGVTSGEISSPGQNYFALATIDSNGL